MATQQVQITYKGKTVNVDKHSISNFTNVQRHYTHTLIFTGPKGGRHLAVVMRSGKVLVTKPGATFSSEWKFFAEATVTGL